MQSILDEPTIATLRDGPFVGIHIRRGDKIGSEAQLHEVKVKLFFLMHYMVLHLCLSRRR